MAAGESPWRDDAVTTPCPVCTTPFVPTGRQSFCSHACRQAAYRRRCQPPAPVVVAAPRGQRRQFTVYACPACDARFLGAQRCPDCNVFCRRIGVGGCCPSCDEPVAIEELMSS